MKNRLLIKYTTFENHVITFVFLRGHLRHVSFEAHPGIGVRALSLAYPGWVHRKGTAQADKHADCYCVNIADSIRHSPPSPTRRVEWGGPVRESA